MGIDVKSLAVSIAMSEKEEEVIDTLKRSGLWDNHNHWKPFGNNENNFSTIGNQQSTPDAALVEKLINSVDAILMKECLIRGINPESPNAPQSIQEALTTFFEIRDGKLSNLDTKSRNRLSQNIIVSTTGSKVNPNYTIVDFGEGQTPKKMPDTILSLGKSNKLRVPFVQGKFNMGGTGVFQFCGKNNVQLIITRKCPEIECIDDKTKDLFGFTVIRRDNPSGGRRSSMYTYLADTDGSIMSFSSEGLEIVPVSNGHFRTFSYGMFIKMYEYDIGSSLRTNILHDLNYRLALLMPGLAHPIRLIECRNYTGHTLETTLSGLNVRLEDDRNDNLEDEFPTSCKFNVLGQRFYASIFAFRNGGDDKYRNNEGVLFTINGQTHGYLNKAFFRRNAVGLSYIADSILIVIDCSGIDGRTREDLFMNSRDRLREGELKKMIETSLEDILKHHPGLRALQEERRRNAIAKRLQDEKPLADVLKNILKKSPTLSTLFLSGERLQNPFNLTQANSANAFKGRKHPTYFILKNKPNVGDAIKNCPINHRFRVQFKTDATNDYFDRDVDAGEFNLSCNGFECSDYVINLHNGTANLTVTLPMCNVGDALLFNARISDNCLPSDIEEHFIVKIEKPEEYDGRKSNGSRANPSDGGNNGSSEKQAGLSLPKTIELQQHDWEQYSLTRENALIVRGTGEDNIYDFYINMDNIHLKTELKAIKDVEKINLLKARYKYSMVLIGLSIINYCKTQADEKDVDVEDLVSKTTSIISPILLPMIDSMSELDINELIDTDTISA